MDFNHSFVLGGILDRDHADCVVLIGIEWLAQRREAFDTKLIHGLKKLIPYQRDSACDGFETASLAGSFDHSLQIVCQFKQRRCNLLARSFHFFSSVSTESFLGFFKFSG